MSVILDKVSNSLASLQPFVAYRKSNATTLKGVFPKDDQLRFVDDLAVEGFVFAPFNNANKNIFFPKESSEVFEEEVSVVEHSEVSLLEDLLLEKEAHEDLVAKGVAFIARDTCKKVVLSRKEVHQLEDLELLSTFKNLLLLYPNAMVYIWYHPQVGLWFGATPERLITIDRGKFATMALASTQSYEGTMDVVWGEKEQQEHQFVVDYIQKKLLALQNQGFIRNFNVSKTYTTKAGSLLHLKADISGTIEHARVNELVAILHPTPAVCGLPKKEAKAFILANEGYDREFYTGYFGEIVPKGLTDLYVNLRCAQWKNSTLSVYVGGGVTIDSNPEKEWLETVNKTKTIKKAIKI